MVQRFLWMLASLAVVATTIDRTQAQTLQLEAGAKPVEVVLSKPITVVVKEPESLPKPEFLSVAGLTEFGFGLGVAVASVTPWGSKDGADQQDTIVAAMPYMTVLPAYWFMGSADLTRQYCARKSLTLSRASAQDVTNAYAIRRARRAYEKDRNAAANTPARCVGATGMELTTACQTVSGMLTQAPAAVDLSASDGTWNQQKAISIVYAHWNPEVGGDCVPGWPNWLGFYLGMPVGGGLSSNYKSTTDEWSGIRSLDSKGRVSIGVAIAPSPYLNLLLGMTRVDAIVPVRNASDDPATEFDESKNVASQAHYSKSWNVTFAVGGTVDLLGAIFKFL